MALLKEKIGSSSFNRNLGTLFKSVSSPTQRNDFFVNISSISPPKNKVFCCYSGTITYLSRCQTQLLYNIE